MNIDEITYWVKNTAKIQHSRSSGPGGQNINKVNTRVTLRIPLESLPVTTADGLLLRQGLSGRINNEDELVISSGDTRSQFQNRCLAETRAVNLISGALHRPRKRRKTKPTRSSVEKRLIEKKHRSDIKKNRRIV
ncbi:MAG: aminoacyl-tRNA hydrolase [Spirochaetales bacterium]|nr:aminoacyl-tRNA hydrolase [Spirochaetales bacterium]